MQVVWGEGLTGMCYGEGLDGVGWMLGLEGLWELWML